MKMRTHVKGKEERMGTRWRQQIKDRMQSPEISNLGTNGWDWWTSVHLQRGKKFHYSRETRKAQTNAPALTIWLIFPSLMFLTSSHMCYSGKSWWWSKAIRSKQPFRFKEFSKAYAPLLFLSFFSFSSETVKTLDYHPWYLRGYHLWGQTEIQCWTIASVASLNSTEKYLLNIFFKTPLF